MAKQKYVIYLSELGSYYVKGEAVGVGMIHAHKDINKAKKFTSIDAMASLPKNVLEFSPRIFTVNEIVSLEVVKTSEILTELPEKKIKFFK